VRRLRGRAGIGDNDPPAVRVPPASGGD
jgi:hypothetical protein